MKLNKKKASFSIVLVFLVIGFLEITLNLLAFIGKYLSSLHKLDHVIAPKEGFETQL